MMKKYIYLPLMAILCALSACDDPNIDVDALFTFSKLQVNTTFIYYEVYPKENKIPYTIFLVSSEELNRRGSRAIVDSIHAQLQPEQIYTTGKRVHYTDLTPGTRYYLCCYLINKDGKPNYNIAKHPQTTAIDEPYTFTATVSASGTTLQIHPTTTDTYYWDYCSLYEVDKDYQGIPQYYYYYKILYYQEREMISYVVDRGEGSEDAAKYYPNLNQGDTLCVMVGYYNEKTDYCPSPQLFYAIYQAEEKTFKIEGDTLLRVNQSYE